MNFTFKCAHCAVEFKKAKRGYLYCSQRCANRDNAKGCNLEMLAALAQRGDTANFISMALGIHPATVRAKLQELGIYRTWQYARYAKARQ